MNKNSVGWVKIKLKILIGLLAIILFISSFSAFADAPFATTGIEITENEITIDVDYEKFNVANGSTVEFEVQQMGIYDDGDNITSYRNPVSTVVSTTSTGGTLQADPSMGKK